jgi:hypothetical protein
MIVNFRARVISRGARKLIQTPILIKKKDIFLIYSHSSCYIHNRYLYFTRNKSS